MGALKRSASVWLLAGACLLLLAARATRALDSADQEAPTFGFIHELPARGERPPASTPASPAPSSGQEARQAASSVRPSTPPPPPPATVAPVQSSVSVAPPSGGGLGALPPAAATTSPDSQPAQTERRTQERAQPEPEREEQILELARVRDAELEHEQKLLDLKLADRKDLLARSLLARAPGGDSLEELIKSIIALVVPDVLKALLPAKSDVSSAESRASHDERQWAVARKQQEPEQPKAEPEAGQQADERANGRPSLAATLEGRAQKAARRTAKKGQDSKGTKTRPGWQARRAPAGLESSGRQASGGGPATAPDPKLVRKAVQLLESLKMGSSKDDDSRRPFSSEERHHLSAQIASFAATYKPAGAGDGQRPNGQRRRRPKARQPAKKHWPRPQEFPSSAYDGGPKLQFEDERHERDQRDKL